MAIDLSLAKDWIYVFCIPIQTFFGLAFFHWWWDRRKTKQDQKREDEQREEDRQKADAETIAAILSEKYDEVEETYHTLKRTIDKLKANRVGTLTEFDVLLYMCRPENLDKFSSSTLDSEDYLPLSWRNGNGLARAPISPPPQMETLMNDRQEVMSAVDIIMKFFLQFRIKLFSIMQNKACPADIKLEFSTKITEMGGAIHPFVEEHRQDVIKRVLNYFVAAANVEASLPSRSHCCGCFLCRSVPGVSRCCGRQGTSIEMSSMGGPSNANQASSGVSQGPELKHYPGNSEIKQAIPYIAYLRYEDGKMSCDLTCRYSAIGTLAILAQKGKIDERTSNNILGEIRKFLPNARDDLLHWVRMVMFQLSEDYDFQTDEFDSYVKDSVNFQLNNEDPVIYGCNVALDNIQTYIGDCRTNSRVNALLKKTETRDFLQAHAERMRKFIVDMLKTPKAAIVNRRHSCKF